MGGNAFDKENPAARLSSDQLLQLSAYVSSRLTGCFIKTQHLLFLDSKTSHGDLDLLCAWDAPDRATNGKAPKEAKEAFAEELAKKVGAKRWKTSGSRVGSLEVHLAVPVGCLHSGLRFSEAYYQVDLLLCLPEHFDFRLFIGSYGLTAVILGHAIKSVSGKLFLQEEKLVLRHAAIDEVPQIVLLLSSDVKEVCAWLGVSYGRWQEGFADEETYWRWTVEVPERSVLWYAWRRLARKHEQGYNPPFELKRRTVEMVRYYAWLQTTDLASSRHDVQPGAGITKVITDVAISTGHANADNDSETAPLLEAASAAPIAASTQPELPTEFALSGTTARDDNDRVRFRPRYRDYKPAPAVPAGSPVAYITRISELEAEIEKPARWDLDRGALRTLEHFGMRTRYFDVVAVRREEKRVLLCAQLRNVRQREEEMRSWRKWISARLRRVVRMLFRAVLKREKSE